MTILSEGPIGGRGWSSMKEAKRSVDTKRNSVELSGGGWGGGDELG